MKKVTKIIDLQGGGISAGYNFQAPIDESKMVTGLYVMRMNTDGYGMEHLWKIRKRLGVILIFAAPFSPGHGMEWEGNGSFALVIWVKMIVN